MRQLGIGVTSMDRIPHGDHIVGALYFIFPPERPTIWPTTANYVERGGGKDQ